MSLRVYLVTLPMVMGAIGALHAEDTLCGNGQTGFYIPLPNGQGFHAGICNVGNNEPEPSNNGGIYHFSSTTVTPDPSNTGIYILPPTIEPSGTVINLPSTILTSTTGVYILPSPTVVPSGTTIPIINSETGVYRFSTDVTPTEITSNTGVYRFSSITNTETPNSTGMAVATVNVGNLVGNNIMSRVTGGADSGVNTGDALIHRGMWMQGFGNFTNQQNKGGMSGYQANTAGATIGVDTDELVEGITLGTALSYANSTVDSKASNNASTDADSYMVSVYGSKDYASGLYVAGQAGLGFNNYDSRRRTSGATTDTTADFDSYQYTGRIDAGVNLPLAHNTTFTPLASAQFTHLDLDSYTEQGPSALQVDKSTFDTADLGIGGKLAWDWALANGYILKPNVRAKYILTVGDRTLVTTNRVIGNGTTFTTQGVEADSSSLNLGAGLLIANAQATEITLDYDADLRASLIGHALQVKIRMPF